ncbi:MAG: InlB B-repeat-containing protein [Firmicutes bacterium]|nr:InlB B-repeat-containing protein [Bacillota bacterium]
MGAGIGGGSNASGAWGLGADLKVNNDATITAFSKDYIAIDALSISTDNEFYLGIFSLSESISSELSINVFDDSETIVQNLKLPANNISFAFTVFEPTEVSFQASRIVSGTTVYGLVFDGIGPLSDGLGLTFDINGFNEFDAELFDYIVLTFNANGSYFETAGITTKIILLLPDEVFSDNNLIPQIASQTGYNFSGWFYETNAETEFSEDDSFISNKTVYAIWTPYNFTISFDLNYDTIDAIGSFNIDYDASVGILPSPARSGYNFEGWYDNEQSQLQNNTIYNFTQNIILTAQWSPKSFLINFVTDVQFMIIPDKTATYLEQIGILDEPERRGYTFEGWYIDLEDENTKISSESIFYYTNNLTLHAKWSNEASNNTDIYQILTYAFIGTSLSLGLLSLILILKIKRKKV